MKEHKIRICPKCKSPDIDYKPTALESATGRIPFTMKCNKCGFKFKIIVEKEINAMKKKSKK